MIAQMYNTRRRLHLARRLNVREDASLHTDCMLSHFMCVVTPLFD